MFEEQSGYVEISGNRFSATLRMENNRIRLHVSEAQGGGVA
jgi:hypothetical protein